MYKSLLAACFVLLTSLSWSQSGVPRTGDNQYTVLFATTEDCDLFINEAAQGSVLKSDFKYLVLSGGTYSYRARSRKSSAEISGRFAVGQGQVNEVFLDVALASNKQPENGRVKIVPGTTQQAPDAGSSSTATDNRIQTAGLQTSKEAESNTVNFLMTNVVMIQGGKFIMGNNKVPAKDEKEHTATIDPVYFGKYEVTQYQWESIMGNNPSNFKGCPTCPVENVSWEEVMAFIQKLNALSNRRFRLPTEAEWEFVARMGGKAEIDQAGGQEGYIKKTAWFFGNSDKKTHPVGTIQPASSGVYDLAGNVSEWCLDWYHPNYNGKEGNVRNPQGPALGKEEIVRGGNYKDYIGDHFRPSYRSRRNPTEKGSELGFRLVMELQ